MELMSPTLRVSKSKPRTIAVTVNMAAKDAGIALVILGRPQIIVIVSRTKPSMVLSCGPSIHSSSPSLPGVLKDASWARKITIASPFTKPNMTGCGTRRINLPSLRKPAVI